MHDCRMRIHPAYESLIKAHRALSLVTPGETRGIEITRNNRCIC